MVRLGFSLLFGAFMTAAAPAALAQDNLSPVDPQAREIALNTANFLASQQDLSFNWFASFDEIVDDSEKITYFQSGNIILDRGNGFVAQTERGNTYRDFYFDGSVFSIASPNEDFYASMEISGGFETLARIARERADITVPLWSMLSKDLPETIMENVEAGAYLGTTLIAGQPVHHLSFSQSDFDWQIWVSVDEDAPVPLMLIGTEHGKTGWPQYRAYFSQWNMEPEITDGQFAYQPEEGDVQVSFPAQPAASSGTQSE